MEKYLVVLVEWSSEKSLLKSKTEIDEVVTVIRVIDWLSGGCRYARRPGWQCYRSMHLESKPLKAREMLAKAMKHLAEPPLIRFAPCGVHST
jgi:hypothetical protein